MLNRYWDCWAFATCFWGIIDLEDTDPYCKPPHKGAFEKAFALANTPPKAEESLFVDDRVNNLNTAKTLGIYTLLVSAITSMIATILNQIIGLPAF